MKLAVILLAVVLAGCSTLPRTGSKGTMPPPGPNGEVDPSAMPDFIAVAGDVGQVGWVEKAAVTDPSDRTWPVYADDLVAVVGHMVPGKGFVPAGVDPKSVPTKDVQVGPASPDGLAGAGNVQVYVRNCSTAMAWIAVISGGRVQPMGAAGFWGDGNMGVGDFVVPEGALLVIVDRSPTEPGVAARQLIYTAGTAVEPVARWVNVDPAGVATMGSGTPGWWEGVQPPC